MKFEQSIYQAFKDSALKYPKQKAFIYMNKSFSYSFVLKRINQFAEGLLNMGVKKGDPVTVCLPNIPDAIYVLYAINQIGAIVNAVHPLFNYEQMLENIELTKTKYVFCLETHYPKFKALAAMGVTFIACSPVSELSLVMKAGYKLSRSYHFKEVGKVKRASEFYKLNGVEEFNEDYKGDAVYLHSGGTSGKPKTIGLSSYAMNALADTAPWIMNFEEKDWKGKGMLAVLPIFHGFGLEVGVHFMLCFGGTDVLMPKFNRKQTIKYIKKNQVHCIIGVPVLFEGLLASKKFVGKNIKNMIISFVGGDFVSQSLIDRYNQRMAEAGSICKLYQGYGLTETVTVCSVNTPKLNKDASLGKALPGVKFKVVDSETLKELKPNEDGELLVSGTTLMNGYVFSSEEENEHVFIKDKDGVTWIRTGDQGYLDEDGYFYFKQRIKRIIKVNGVAVFPSEIENSIHKLDYVYECAAIGIEDEKFGHIAKVFIVLNKEYRGNIEVAKQEIIDQIVKDNGVYARPKEVVFLEKLPHTMVGKIDVKLLK